MKTIDEEIKINDQLNPALWDNNELKEDVKEKLLDIVDNFLDGLKEDKINIDVVDVRLLGSNANYNYTDKSDIDLHIVADFSSTPCEQNVMPQLYNAYRSLFSKAYNIKINGYDVELYVEDVNQPARSNGVYSLYTGWISEPKRSEIPEINWEQFELVFDGMEDRYFDVVGEHSDEYLGATVNEEYANNIDKDILDTIKNPLEHIDGNTKCSKSAGTMLDYYFYETDKPLKLCLGAIRNIGDDSEPKSITHVWIEVDGKIKETRKPNVQFERVLIDELLIDRNEDLYNQVEEFLNKPSLREEFTTNIKTLIAKLKDYGIEASVDKELYNDYNLTIKDTNTGVVRKVKVSKTVKPTKEYCKYLKDYLDSIKEDLQETDSEEDDYLYGLCHQWALDNSVDGDKFFAIIEYDDGIERNALLHSGIFRDDKYIDVSGSYDSLEDVLDNFDYGEYEDFILSKSEFINLLNDLNIPFKDNSLTEDLQEVDSKVGYRVTLEDYSGNNYGGMFTAINREILCDSDFRHDNYDVWAEINYQLDTLQEWHSIPQLDRGKKYKFAFTKEFMDNLKSTFDKLDKALNSIEYRLKIEEIDLDRKDIIYGDNDQVAWEESLKEDLELSNEYDSEGNQLTQEQVEFFKNSKVRDNQGRLLVCYHGSDADRFDTFDHNFIGDDNKSGYGFYFTLGTKLKFKYASEYACYINLTNPLTDMETIGRYVRDGEDLRSKGFTQKEIIDKLSKKYKCDGIINQERGVIAFEPNQIKSITNKTPSNSDNINEDLLYDEETDLPLCTSDKQDLLNSMGDTLYHCTPRKNLKSIYKNGLKNFWFSDTTGDLKDMVNSNYDYGYTGNELVILSFPKSKLDLSKIDFTDCNNGEDDVWNNYGYYNGTISITEENLLEEELKPMVKEDLSQEVDSEGNPLTKEQVEFFKNSKVRDSRGRLLVVYHGTDADFDTFKKEFMGTNPRFKIQGGGYAGANKGFFFTNDKWYASHVGKNVKKCYLNITNPLNVKDFGWGSATSQLDRRKGDIYRWLEEGNNDGIVVTETDVELYKNPDDLNDDTIIGFDTVFVVFNPNQIKSIDNKNPSNSNNINEDWLSDANKVEAIRQELNQAYDDLMGNDKTRLYRYREWANNSNNDYKEYIYNDLKKNKDKSLRLWYNTYRLRSGDYDLSYDDFLRKPFKLYRATNVDEKDSVLNPFFSYALTRQLAQRFLSGVFNLDKGRTGEIEEIEVTPSQTLGMFPSDEEEIIIPNTTYEKDNQSILDRVNKLVDYANENNVELPYDQDELIDIFKKEGRDKDNLEQQVIAYVDKSKGLKEDLNNYGYHAGDLGKSEGRERQTGGRGTGHFGTGTYFVGNPEKIQGYNDYNYGKGEAPHHIVDFSKYNLYKPSNNDYGFKLHRALSELNNGYKYYTKYGKDLDYFINRNLTARRSGEFECKDIPEIVSHLNNLLWDYEQIELPTDIDWNTIDDEYEKYDDIVYNELRPQYTDENGDVSYGKLFDAVEEKIEEKPIFKERARVVKEVREAIESEITENIVDNYKNSKNIIDRLFNALEGRHSKGEIGIALKEVDKHLDDKTGDSLSTIFMKDLGYDGVDTRGLSGLDNTTYGSVIYDVKPETIVEGAIDKK